MARVPIWRRYLRFFGPDIGADVSDELRFHLDAKIRELMEKGLSQEDARQEAMRRFGDLAEVSALCQHIGEGHSRKIGLRDRMADWWYDARHAARSLRLAPWFALAAVVTLASGIAGASSLFSVVEAWVIRAVRFPQPQQLIFARSLDTRRGNETTVSFPDYQDFASRTRTLQSLAAWSPDFFTISLTGAPERIMGANVSTNFFETLQVKPALGRGFLQSESEFGRHHVAIVSYGFWKARLNGDASAIGSRLNVNGEPYIVVGVLPERFHFTLVGRSNIWIPLAPAPEDRARRQTRYLQLVGRLNPGRTAGQAGEELKAIAARLAQEHPDTNQSVSSFCISLSEEIGRHVGDQVVIIVFAVTLGLLLICCSNVANLLLVRALGRKRQAAIRISLGASRLRLIRQALIETLTLFLLSAVAGALGGAWFTKLATSFIPYDNRGYLPDYGEASLNWTVLAFVAAICLLTGLIFGLGPALESSDANLTTVLKESGSSVSQSRKASRLRFALVIGQVVVASVLLSSTAVLVRSLRKAVSVPLGFESAGVLTFRLSLDERQYTDTTRVRAFFESLADTLETGQEGRPAIASSTPFSDNDGGQTSFRIQGSDLADPADTRRLPAAVFNAVSPEFFAVLRTPVLSGRAFERGDSQGGRIPAIVNDAFVSHYLQGRNAIGQVLQLGRIKDRTAVIVGVVAEIRESNDTHRGYSQIYVPFAQAPTADAYILLKTSHDPLGLLPAIRQRTAGLDPRQPIYDAKTLDERVNEGFAPYRIFSGLLVWFGFLALVLAAIGVYGVVAFTVSQRTHEIGIRAALGADRLRLELLCLREGIWILVAGVMPGLVAGFAAALGLRSIVQEIAPASLWAPLLLTAALLGAVVLIATLIPARRAASVDPLTALRCQ